MRLYERLAAAARSNLPIPDKGQKVVGGGGGAGDPEPLAQPVGDDEQLSPVLVVTRDDAERGDESVQDLLNRLDERGWFSNSSSTSADLEAVAEPEHKQKIPKIIHATWKTDTVPVRWAEVRQGCIDLHPDYEFKLWSDAASRAFIAEHYPWFLSTFDGYTYPIQRADVIRYFVLHHFGGIYMDLDIGCRRNLDPFLYFDVILPATIPVGVSNDLMFAERGHPFMDLVIHNLITFDHSYGTNYPTVMFSTGPMFVSAVYGMWPKDVDEGVERQVRILPRRWYGKNAPVNEMHESYFDHFYGSSWHADDAGFITFLGKFGIALMYVGLGIVVLG
ncbi:glycosyltransferase family 32 protein, partial [Rhodotorula graminis WP1]